MLIELVSCFYCSLEYFKLIVGIIDHFFFGFDDLFIDDSDDTTIMAFENLK